MTNGGEFLEGMRKDILKWIDESSELFQRQNGRVSHEFDEVACP